MSGTLHEDPSSFYCSRRHEFAIKQCCALLSIFILVTMTCSATIYTTHCCDSIAEVVTRTRHNVTSYVHGLSCLWYPKVYCLVHNSMSLEPILHQQNPFYARAPVYIYFAYRFSVIVVEMKPDRDAANEYSRSQVSGM
jgi:hypothetical protein